MMKFNKIFTLFLLFTLSSCSKEDKIDYNTLENAMLFGIKDIAQTKVIYNEETDNSISAKFKEDETIGLYAFYNNFYFYYSEYESFAESVIFANQGLTINKENQATYSPLRSWTFSTIYGTAPHTLDCLAYYPFREGHNPKYAHVYNDPDGAATFEYYYVEEDKVNSDIDFMTAHTRYDDSETPENFRNDMLALKSIPFSFTRRCASLNLKVTKPKEYTTDITVTKITVYFDAFTKFSQTIGAKPQLSWSDMTTGYALEASTTCNKALTETTWDGIPEEGATHKVENLLKHDEMLFFPPDTQINKIVFTLTDDKTAKSYTWHPHIATIKANTAYILNLELDPNRAN